MPQTQLPYRYKRLTSTATTRLVQIQPSTASGSGLVVNIVEAFPSGPLEYDALSYTWGTAEPDKPIVANNDRRLLVTDNLAKAMRRFRHATEVVSLWIDQLCIDQRNARERSLQVAMMGTIYRSARKVIVWLGDDVQDDGSSQQQLNLKPGLRLAGQILDKLREEPRLKFDWSNSATSSLPRAGNRPWQALAAILRRPWFGRMWVIQEVVLSSCIEVYCGREMFTWDEVGKIVDYLDCDEYRAYNIRNSELVTELPFSRINRIKKQHEQGVRPDLFELMLACRHFGATDERDKIYALLELGEHDITPDYSMSPRDVFVDFAARTIRMAQQRRRCCDYGIENPHQFHCCVEGLKDRDKYLRIMTMLCCAGSTNQRQILSCSERLPSWVPDWTQPLKVRPFCFWGSKTFMAGGSEYGEISVRDEGARLSIPGKLFDTVRAAGSVNLNLTDIADAKVERELITQWYADCDRIVAQNRFPYPVTGKEPRVVMKKILEHNGIGETTAAAAAAGATVTARKTPGHNNNTTAAQQRPQAYQQRRSSGNLIDDLASPQWVLPDQHYESTMGVAVGRVLFLTTSGYMGLAPHGTRDGDVVFVVLGCDIPFVLRPAGGGDHCGGEGGGDYVLLGECFVYKAMDGEAMRDDSKAVQDVTVI
ncbi:putative het domain protein [Lasiodiplodia theobromae]|uniref:Heterokaryon incompatibility protein 6 n=1 Tax=Lasiodiplodia theobromae TaxID=45133 RepID=A0A5N5D9L1_9PEZI|nr:Heterokaryon incompatibility protein [Lasiodiplodia theobromae]KAB2573914.1 Heterokaryon incompatibility protein 6 [Lasiodiplodia theobromae]KAF4541291.1 Heterokaryon incompatibility protein [Lasiodiplodia theobromae]KAF9632746.1 putative het domain protein [Lasiodiplodia theobromae]